MSWIPCPACGAVLPAQPLACPRCALRLTGPDAVRLWQVDQQLTSLQSERITLLGRLRADPTTSTQPEPASAASPAATAQPAQPALPGPPPAPSRRSWTTQQTLLGVGVLLVLVASTLALALAWFIIGPYGQVLVLGGFTVLAAVVALHLSRRSLPSSAEALAVVCGGLTLLDLAAARRMGLLGLDGVDGRLYAVVSGLLAALVLGWLHTRDRRIAGFAVLSLTAASVAWAAVVSYAGQSPAPDASRAAVALLGAGVFALLRLRLPQALGLVRRVATGPAGAWSTLALLFGASGALTSSDPRQASATTDGLLSALVLVLLATTGPLVLRRVAAARVTRLGSRAAVRADWVARPLHGDWRALGLLAGSATLALPLAVLGLTLQLGPWGSSLLCCGAGAALVALLALRPARSGLGALWTQCQAGTAVLLTWWVAMGTGPAAARVSTLLVVAVSALALSVLRPRWCALATGVSAAAGIGALAVATSVVSPTTQSLSLALGALVLAGTALARPGAARELALAIVAVLTGLAALLVALGHDLPTWVVVLTLAAITLGSGAAAVLRRPLRVVGTLAATLPGCVALWLLGSLWTPPGQLALVAVAALALVALGAWRRGHGEEAVLVAAGAVMAVAATGDAVLRDWPHTASALAAAYGVVFVAYAALPRRRGIVTLGVGALTVAAWLEALQADLDTLEAYTLPPAALLLAAGLWSRRELGNHSWLTVGPGLAVGLLPSALATTVDDNLVRVALSVATGAAALALGAVLRRQALVVLGAVGAVVVALTQLGPIALQLPKSLVIGVLGVGLLVIGARYEQRRADAGRAASWLASLT